MSDIRIVAGLGNPGSRYTDTRHNIGFAALDWYASDRRLGNWRSGDGIEWLEGTVGTKKIFFVKPLTFMNRSGEPLQRFMNYHKITGPELVVVHDEVDIPLGSVRVKQGGSEGGHNGLKSITQQLSTADYVRIRIGVSRPENPNIDTADWVLSRFAGTEQQQIQRVTEHTARVLEGVIEWGAQVSQNMFNSVNIT